MRPRDWRYPICVLAVTFVYSAVSEYCFQNRDPSGALGKCEDLLDTETTRASCCAAGGVGWTTKANGKRCEDTCAGQGEEEEEEVGDGGAQSEWSSWSHCDVTCGEGVSTRHRTCSDGDACHGDDIEESVCFEGECPIDGGWSDWGDWVDCTKTCNTGYRERERGCNNPPPQHGGQNCTGRAKQEQPCGTDPCPIAGGWTEWSDWGRCSVTCEDGISRRRRSCTDPEPQYGGAICVGERRETAECNEGPCPIDGGWGEYGPAGECSGTCDSEAHRVYKDQRRMCNNPPPQYGGLNCEGSALRRVRCRELPKCAIHGNWSDWSEWSDCSQTCDEGLRTRDRTCTNPIPQYGGEDCEGDTTGTKVCKNPRRCPVDGGWTEWDPWTPCDAPQCGLAGRQMRSRSCTNPSPKRGGAYCQGPIIERQACERLCAYWTEWSDWSSCSGGCTGSGFQKRYRKCLGEGALPSSDPYQDLRNCDICIEDDEDYQIGSGSGSGSGSGDWSGDGSGKQPVVHEWNPICDDAESCKCAGGDGPGTGPEDSISYEDPILDSSSSKPDCGETYDYSVVYDDCKGEGDPAPDPEEAINSNGEPVEGGDPAGDGSDPASGAQGAVEPEEANNDNSEGASDSSSFDNNPAGGSSDSYSLDDDPGAAVAAENADVPVEVAADAGNDVPAGSSSDYVDGDAAGVVVAEAEDAVYESDSYSI